MSRVLTAEDEKHIVDVLIEERAQKLMQRPLVWQLVKTFCYPILGYRRAIEMVDIVRDMSGPEIFEYMSNLLEMRVAVSGIEHVPSSGLAMVMANHPAGIADGIAVYDALKPVRDDLVFFANRDAVRAASPLADMIIPVEWMETRRDHARNKETVRAMLSAIRAEKLIVIFPSGRLARPTLTGLIEREWMPSGVALAEKYRSPIIPMHVKGRNSFIYYLFWLLNTELKDMTLFRELLNKHQERYAITIGAPFTTAGTDPNRLAAELRGFVTEALPRGASCFSPPLRSLDTPTDG